MREKITIGNEWDKTYKMISWWKADDVKKAKVMVVGSGALGNEVLKNLALLNVGFILIVDFDTIEYSNLSRSVMFRESDCGSFKADVTARQVRTINPNVKVMTIKGDIMLDVGIGIFRRMDVVIGCLDNRIARLFINRHSFKVGKTWIDGAIENLAGELSVYKPGVACYESQLTAEEWANIRHKMGCPDVAVRNSLQGKIPTTPISSSIIAAMQVQEALKVVMGNEKQSLAGKKFLYEGMNNIIMIYQSSQVRESIIFHEEGREIEVFNESMVRYDPIIEFPNLSANTHVKDALDIICKHFEDEDATFELDNEIILKVVGRESEKVSDTIITKPHFSEEKANEFRAIQGEDILVLEETYQINRHFRHQDVPLHQLGVPYLHILKVRSKDTVYYVELTGDESFLNFT